MDFTGKTAVVTGGASGMGYAMAERFLAEGANVVIADIEREALDRAAHTLGLLGDVLAVRTDVSSEESVQALADETIERFGGVHILCNNAGVETGGSFGAIAARSWRWVMDVNFFGVLNGCRVFLPLLEEQPEAHIVNTASVAAFNTGTATMTPYATSKFAVLALSESLDIELRARNATVAMHLLAPGPVKTRMVEAERNKPADVQLSAEPERIAQMENLARLTAEVGLEPSEVAGMVYDAIQDGGFFILTHPEHALTGVRKRLHWMETGEAPAPRIAGT
ncbi:MAG: oxidoreductase [Microbacterium sp. 67-17]|jgi:NAD(P)-dependent dehydrogenase (short-subunit alcohol dehydrogenase family)|uniref:SDR family NAD(P)-dependent oxidoreductase n=1 Tax=Microbacterium sp. 67-17 TaxID=1895782 RepID=UPI00095F9200|nr:SDR family NAD(P)-dependent oxidoreductase [Microbacterium sp. 67-17]OJW02525.1 MAG: oxidoreductase [Microbacterium sp. 67-17]